jgi:hypothetical protein
MNYRCECGKAIGLMADKEGKPEVFKCPYTGRKQRPQVPIRRETKIKVIIDDK